MVQEQVHQVSLNGLESFIEASPDYELAPIGLGSMREQVEKLAEYGRYGDIYVVHAAEGETVVPMEVLEANPKIKSLLFDQMSQMGLDPERYVVGNNLNSLNPVTGMPEFFFKKIWKSVKKVLTHPVVASTLGNIIAPGIGGLIGSAVASRVRGDSWGDVLKNTALSWGTQALMGAATGKGDFFPDLWKGVKAPIQALQGAVGVGGFADPFEQGYFGSAYGVANEGGLFPGYYPAYGAYEGPAMTEEIFTDNEVGDFSLSGNGAPRPQIEEGTVIKGVPGSRYLGAHEGFIDEAAITVGPDRLYDEFSSPSYPLAVDERSYLSNLNTGAALRGDNVLSGRTLSDDLSKAQWLDIRKGQIERDTTNLTRGEISKLAANEYEALQTANKGPFLAKYGVSPSELLLGEGQGSDILDIGGAGLLAYAGGLFDADEPEQPEPEDLPTNISNQPTAEELLAADRLLPPGERRFTIGGDLLDPFANIPSLDVQVPSMFAAQGGTVNYPRRTGQINGPGTGTSDSIPAMLSNGEFVMTKRAVDGAGGPGTMYDLMRNFEMRT